MPYLLANWHPLLLDVSTLSVHIYSSFRLHFFCLTRRLADQAQQTWPIVGAIGRAAIIIVRPSRQWHWFRRCLWCRSISAGCGLVQGVWLSRAVPPLLSCRCVFLTGWWLNWHLLARLWGFQWWRSARADGSWRRLFVCSMNKYAVQNYARRSSRCATNAMRSAYSAKGIGIDGIGFTVFHQYLGIVWDAFGFSTISDTPASCKA